MLIFRLKYMRMAAPQLFDYFKEYILGGEGLFLLFHTRDHRRDQYYISKFFA